MGTTVRRPQVHAGSRRRAALPAAAVLRLAEPRADNHRADAEKREAEKGAELLRIFSGKQNAEERGQRGQDGAELELRAPHDAGADVAAQRREAEADKRADIEEPRVGRRSLHGRGDVLALDAGGGEGS